MPAKPKISFKPSSPVKATSISDARTQLNISYKYLCTNDKKYSMNELPDNKTMAKFYENFIDKMSEYCKYDNFKKKISSDISYSTSNHIHPIDWKDNRIKEKSFTSLNSDLMRQIEKECWQLGINNQGFRVHGFFIENTFYVVWLDPLHKLYESK